MVTGDRLGKLLSTLISTLQPPKLPASSVDTHVTVLLPIGNVDPDTALQFTDGEAGFASVALGTGENVTTAPDTDVASTT
jgi:hypothetical protein